VSHDKLDAALEGSRASGMRLGETLLSRGWLFEPELAAALAEQFGLRYVDLVRHPLDPSAARPLPLDQAGLGQVLGRRVELVVGERSVIQDAWRYLR
jgi:hypothetical protein